MEPFNLIQDDDALKNYFLQEIVRQRQQISLIASENYASKQVMLLQGSVLTNKYAEGYPGRRYYAGCHWVDEIERLAIDRAKKLFKADYANVQPHSGSQANEAVYAALLKPGETMLAMSLVDGGHLTHGARVSFSGRFYHAVHYGVDLKTGLIDYDQVASLAKKHKPKLIIAGFSAYSGIVDWAKFREIADLVGAYFLADVAHVSGLIAAGLYPSPFPYADVVTSTTHKTLRGPRGGLILARGDETLFKALNFSVFPFTQGGPMMHAIAAKALAFKEAMSEQFVVYQKQVIANARAMVKVFQDHGISVVSGRTDNHQFSLDFKHHKTLTGKSLEQALMQAFIIVNKNGVPGDHRSPQITSGIRIGTPAVTTRGMGITEVKQIAQWITAICAAVEDTELQKNIRNNVIELSQRFLVPSDIA